MTVPQPPAAQYDIAIIGGGLVGASLAVAMIDAARHLSLRIAVIETVPLPANAGEPLQPSYDARATALSYGSSKLLQQIGVWQGLTEAASAIRHIQVSDRGHFGAVHMDAAREGVPALGYVVENRYIGRELYRRMAQADDVIELLCPATVLAAQPLATGMALELQPDEGVPETLSAELVVMADGGRSALRERLGIGYRSSDYEQFAVIANVTLDRPHQGKAYERFTVEGPMALLPLTDSADQGCRCALVWTLPLTEVDEVMGISDEAFIARLHQQFGYRAGRVLAVGERHSYPLQLCQAEEQVRQGLVVLGNAAHTLHPIAGQGFNLALRGALALAETLIEAACAERPLGCLTTLQQFENKLSWDQHKTIAFSDRVTRLFSNQRTDAVIARNLGLVAMDLLPGLKHPFSRSAMGLDVAAPDLQLAARLIGRAISAGKTGSTDGVGS